VTDLVKFPDAMRPVWTSGPTTIAASGGTFLSGPTWGSFDGALVIAALAGTQLRLLHLDAAGGLVADRLLLDVPDRLRTPVLAPDGSLWVTTSNGGGTDRIVRLAPTL